MSDKTKEEVHAEFYKLFAGVEFSQAVAIASWLDDRIYLEKREEAIAFQTWVRDQGYIRRKGLYFSRFVKGVTITDEGLYNLYLQSISNR